MHAHLLTACAILRVWFREWLNVWLMADIARAMMHVWLVLSGRVVVGLPG